MKPVKLTSNMLKKIVMDEAARFGKEKPTDSSKAEEVDADEFADSLEKKIDYEKALKIEETRLRKRFKTVREARIRIRESILKGL